MKNLKFEKINDAKFNALSIENMRSIKGMKALSALEAVTADSITIGGNQEPDSKSACSDGYCDKD